MRRVSAAIAALFIALGVAAGAQAHSLAEVEHDLSNKDQYVQVVNQPAPGFRLSDTEGRPVTPDDLKALRLTWNQIETGLLALTPDFELDWAG